MGRSLSAVGGAPRSIRPLGRDPWLLVVAALVAAGVVAAVAVDLAGRGAFPTHPVAALALGVCAVVVWWSAGDAPDRSVIAVRSLSVSVVAYLWLGVIACAVDHRVPAAIWSAGWIPVNGLLAVVGLRVAAMPRAAIALSSVTAVVAIGAAALTEPTEPFVGLPTAAPEQWSSRLPWLLDTLTVVFAVSLLAALTATIVRAARAHVTERRYLVNCAATTSMGLGLVVMCLALAALRDPGDIDPSTGSVGYLVAIGCTAVLAAHGHAASVWPLRLVLGYWTAAIAIIVGIQASLVRPTSLGVLLTVVTAVGLSAVAFLAVGWLERWLSPPAPHLVAPVPVLSARENEVLAAVAAGATNAGIAAQLFLSERTIEQHLRSIFRKLSLGEHDSSNRRVRAAAVWWQQQASADSRSADDLGGFGRPVG